MVHQTKVIGRTLHRERQSSTRLLIASLQCALVALIILAASPARAINIVINLEDFGDNPGFDSSGSELERIANAAAQIWERLLPGNGTYTVDIWWEPLEGDEPGEIILGRHSPDVVGNNNIRINPDAPVGWFVDDTPLDHSEFNFKNDLSGNPVPKTKQGTALFRELTTAQRADWFIGSATVTLETGFSGRGIADAPESRYDLLSTVLHELGHELGISTEFDGEYEISSAFLGGAGGLLAIQDDETGHMAAQIAPLMCGGCGNTGVRRLPSALDVLAIAGNEGFTTVDLERKYFIQGLNKTNWNSSQSWVGGRVPDGSDDAFLLHGGTVTLSGDARADNLTFGSGSDLSTLNHHLIVDKTVFAPTGSRITVGADGLATFARLDLSGGTLSLADGTAVVDLTVNDGTVSGRGVFQINNLFRNNGSLLPVNGTLSIIGPGSIDLDGDLSVGVVNVIAGDLIVAAPISDEFDGTMRISAERFANLGDWSLGQGGRLTLDGSSSQAATLTSPAGGTFNALGNIVANGRAVIAAGNLQFFGSANVSITNSNDVLFLNSPGVTNFRGAAFTGFGELQQGSDIQVLSTTTLDVGRFDWGNNHNLTINAANLIINAANSGDAGNPYHGDIELNGGQLTVNYDGGWILPTSLRGAQSGNLLLRNSGTGTPTIVGERFTVDSFVEVIGGLARIEADLTTTSNADIFVHAGGHLQLLGNTVFNGGFFNTAVGEQGTIAQHGNVTVGNDVFMDVATYDWGNSFSAFGTAQLNQTNITPGVLFAVRAAGTGENDNVYHGVFNIAGGQLHTEFNAAWTLPDTAGTLQNSKTRGRINFNHIAIGNFGDITGGISGQDLKIAGDVDVQGHLVNANRANIDADVEFSSSAAVSVGFNGVLALLGDARFSGGSYTGAGTIAQGGDFTIREDTTFAVANFDWGNSAGLNVHTLAVASGARFTIDSFILGDADNAFRGTVELRGGQLDVNSNSAWILPAKSLFTTGGTLNLFNGNRGAAPPTLSGQTLRVGGVVNVATHSVFEASALFLDASELNFTGNSTLEFRSTLALNDVAIDHGSNIGQIRSTNTGELQWAPGANVAVQGLADGSFSFDLAAGTSVNIDEVITPTLIIDAGATVNINGAVDPFTSSANAQVHVTVINNSTNSLNILHPDVGVTTLSGSGNTYIGFGAALTAGSIKQNELTNEGTLTLRDGDTTIDTNVLDNTGTVSFSGNTVVTGSVLQGGIFEIAEDAKVHFQDAVSGSGNYTGGGSVRFSSSFAPGESPAEIFFAGDVIFDSAALLDIEIGGVISGDNYDALLTEGTLSLAGTLNITLIDDFTANYAPALGDSFTLFTAIGILGDFDAVLLPTLAVGEWLVTNDGQSYSLSVSAVPVPAAIWLFLAVLPILYRAKR